MFVHPGRRVHPGLLVRGESEERREELDELVPRAFPDSRAVLGSR